MENKWLRNKVPNSRSNILPVLSDQDCRSCKSSQSRKEVLYNCSKQPQGVCLTMKTLLIDWSEKQSPQNFKPCKCNFWSRPFPPKFLAKTQWFYWLYNKERSFYIRISPTLVYAWPTKCVVGLCNYNVSRSIV